jgi:hypothetical protein
MAQRGCPYRHTQLLGNMRSKRCRRLWESYRNKVKMTMKSIILSALLLMLLALTVFGQIDQTHPELCGKPDGVVPLPSNISATVDK